MAETSGIASFVSLFGLIVVIAMIAVPFAVVGIKPLLSWILSELEKIRYQLERANYISLIVHNLKQVDVRGTLEHASDQGDRE